MIPAVTTAARIAQTMSLDLVEDLFGEVVVGVSVGVLPPDPFGGRWGRRRGGGGGPRGYSSGVGWGSECTNVPTISRATPVVTKTSARLKVGNQLVCR